MRYTWIAASAMPIVSALFLLVGCATQAQRQFQTMKTSSQEYLAEMKTCSANIYNSSEYAPLRSHLPLNTLEITLQQMSDSTFATPTEIQATFAVHPQVQACRKALLNGFAQSEPSLVPIFIASYNKSDDALLALIQEKMTWGEFVRQARDRASETQAALLAEDRNVVSGLQQEHQAEIAQRQRAAEALAAWAQTQEMINAANRPITTNCNAFGSMVNCVTR
jgi:ERCC4-related helicase